jgi:hypothetical protein
MLAHNLGVAIMQVFIFFYYIWFSDPAQREESQWPLSHPDDFSSTIRT